MLGIPGSVNSQLLTLLVAKRQDKLLNLSASFEGYWQEINKNFNLEGVEKAALLIGPRAGFTDSRVVYLWLQSWKMFSKVSFKVYKSVGEGLEDLDQVQILQLNQQAWEHGLDSLEYSSEPKIGRK